ncbi:MAG: hypothetical protein UU77_C0053G0010 [candidate division WWE3 bacterium GW2011_GWC1_41_7]|uniref:Uncharacterized protein n=4 Tax=Katanobacteria TaxID=422282 RepID=A0A0G0X2V0_UNCKA|nr:MAG: hypothetical protein UU72_C0023G0017 [candidate division WWE3 bacterium GW2011_GWB1_41_6]KKS19305.1 MAG: hypothetical protein UU77_C0053G0010 [candidate division WWE3 bacterium GW2011_GWC1_41_7]KKS21677.1 MAG: hypothetical protein UU80_C0023G0010 [candidate division WWE3 bacterium GW2011_GWA1_41_8]OGC57528.1 MAG: hypothetical protein A2976_00110 [candidate division WWE3 bacterium RIFCSPLOWO2_01_FULL_41_9]
MSSRHKRYISDWERQERKARIIRLWLWVFVLGLALTVLALFTVYLQANGTLEKIRDFLREWGLVIIVNMLTAATALIIGEWMSRLLFKITKAADESNFPGWAMGIAAVIYMVLTILSLFSAWVFVLLKTVG